MRILISFLFLAISISLTAQHTHHWTGGTGDWNDAQGWDTNQVPGSGDIVLIDGNNSAVTVPAGYTAQVGYVHVGSNRELRVNGVLQIYSKSTVAFNNSGNVVNAGTIHIHSDDTGNGDAYRGSGYGRFVNGNIGNLIVTDFKDGLEIYSSSFINEGQIQINNLQGHAISLNSFNSEFRNERGSIEIAEAETGILVSNGLFTNAGELIIPDDIYDNAIRITGEFVNTVDGYIYISRANTYAIHASSGADFSNAGDIEIYNTGGLHFYSASLENLASGTIEMSNLTSSYALLVTGGGQSVYNWGTIRTSGQSGASINVNGYGTFVNEAGSLLDIQGNGNGSISLSSGFFYNYGVIRAGSQTGPNGISLSGSNARFENNPCGRIDLNGGRIAVNSSTSTFENDAWLFLKDPNASHINNGSFINTGAIADRYGTLSGLNMANSGVITDPLPGPLSAGQAITNALSYGGSSNITSISWYTRRYGPSAGSYNLSTNTYTPNAAAVGDAELWVRVYRSGCGSKWFRVPVTNASPLQAGNPASLPTTLPDLGIAHSTEDWSVYPNPALGDINLSFIGSQHKDLTLELWNTTGQLISRQQYSAEAGNRLPIERPHSAKAGTYRLRIIEAGMEPVVRTIIWN